MDCHTAAAASTAAADRNLPAEKICLRCHDGKRAGAIDAKGVSRLATARREIRFNHRLHLSFGNVAPLLAAAIDRKSYLAAAAGIRPLLDTKDACAACHRGLHQTDSASRANLPQMADCLVCHSQIEPPFSCEKCHTAAASSLKPASHTPEYLDLHNRIKLNKKTCTICHGVNFRCMGCH